MLQLYTQKYFALMCNNAEQTFKKEYMGIGYCEAVQALHKSKLHKF
jgi:hypothetical protein